jgi:hypothetical protein
VSVPIPTTFSVQVTITVEHATCGTYTCARSGGSLQLTEVLAYCVASFCVAVPVVLPHASLSVVLRDSSQARIPHELPHVRRRARLRLRGTQRIVFRQQCRLLCWRERRGDDRHAACERDNGECEPYAAHSAYYPWG